MPFANLSPAENAYNSFITGINLTLCTLSISFAFKRLNASRRPMNFFCTLALSLNFIRLCGMTYYMLNSIPFDLLYNYFYIGLLSICLGVTELIFLQLFLAIIEKKIWKLIANILVTALIISVTGARVVYIYQPTLPNLVYSITGIQAFSDILIVCFALPGIVKVFLRQFGKSKRLLSNETPFKLSVLRYIVAACLYATKMYYIRGSGIFAEWSVNLILDSLKTMIVLTMFSVNQRGILLERKEVMIADKIHELESVSVERVLTGESGVSDMSDKSSVRLEVFGEMFEGVIGSDNTLMRKSSE